MNLGHSVQLNSHSTSSHTHCAFFGVLLHYSHRFVFPSLPLCLSGPLNSCPHPLFHGALTVAGAVTPRQDLGLK